MTVLARRTSERRPRPSRGQRGRSDGGRSRLRAFLRDRAAIAGFVLIGLVVLGAVAAPLVAAIVGHGPLEQLADEALSDTGLPISGGNGFLLGADANGRDVFVRTLYGAQVSLFVGLTSTTIALVLGTAVGLVAGYVGGRTDTVLSSFTDIALAFPFLITALSVVTLNRGPQGDDLVDPAWVVIGIVALFSWTYFARLVRGLVIELKSRAFIQAAVGSGAGRTRIILTEILPNVLPAAVIYWAVQLPANIIGEASLSFLGVGIKAPTPSWGTMIANAQQTGLYQYQPWLLLAPAISLFITILGFNLVSTQARRRFDPRSSGR
ncbi:ABC transporter permease [Herbiconiux sp. CPCC 203407]|uniref:ABC transporter permease n=1 Tax=Herbiconiux oxytropis TaxID=2970915 RepID=A0AA42BWR9_9MICO|nr:ABC transporter permease [Herbiconiux oxytropis]MCS5724084.1 ABC transporter permease [Herbiconiux oxytropis]MCS5726983.1 ABC transporter permease [Herbiconiux oxytropis]